MKIILVLFSVLNGLSSFAGDCLDVANYQVCTNDTVYVYRDFEESRGGTVVSVDVIEKTVKVKYDWDPQFPRKVSVNIVGLVDGCLKYVCAGDEVFRRFYNGSGYALTEATAIFPIMKLIAFPSGFISDGERNIGWEKEDSMVPARGCFKGYCVGDRVFPSNWKNDDELKKQTTEIVAIDPYLKKVVVEVPTKNGRDVEYLPVTATSSALTLLIKNNKITSTNRAKAIFIPKN